MSTFELTRPRKDINFSGAADPLNTTPAKVGQSYQNTTSGEIFHCTDDTGAVYTWVGTLGTQVLPLAAILASDHPNLLVMYTMDNINGSTLIDESLNSNNGSITGATAVAGQIDNALSFDGISDTADCGFHPTGSTGAISVWFKTAGVGTFVPFSLASPVLEPDSILFAYNSNNRYAIYQNLPYNATNNYVLSDSSFPSDRGVWTHIIFQSTGSDWEMYRNGVLLPQTFQDGVGGAWLGYIGSADPGKLMHLNSLVPVFYEAGAIDQFRLFNRALTQEEVTALYQEGL